MNQTCGRWLRLGVILAAVVLCATPTLAADDDPAKTWKEPGLQMMEKRTPWAQWLAATLFAGGCLAIAFKHPHRSHLD